MLEFAEAKPSLQMMRSAFCPLDYAGNDPKRFDTYFYMARARPYWRDGSGRDSIWITARQALADADAKKRTVISDRMNIEKFAKRESVDDALAQCGDVITVTPFIEKEGEKSFCGFRPMPVMATRRRM